MSNDIIAIIPGLQDAALLRVDAYLASGWTAGASKERFKVYNPANGKLLAQVATLSVAQVEQAITDSARAQAAWQQLTAKDRALHLQRWFQQIIDNTEDLALLMTTEQGKSLGESRGEIAYAASFIQWFAEEGKRAYGDVIPPVAADKRLVAIKQPVGVCAAITPWNFPAAMITRKAAPALAAGCSIIIKPAEQTPLTALALAVLAERAGIPAGVLQVVTGNAVEIGKVLTSSPVVRKLSFTGSTEVGRLLYQQCAPTIKRLSLELGGNAPFIVFDDADIDAAVQGAIASKYRNSGQTCVCANRFLVQDGIYDLFVEKFTRATQQLRVGDGLEPGTELGPLIDQDAVTHAQAMIADALSKGAKLLCGGQLHALGGTFFEPTVLANADPTMRVAAEEVFGPVAPIFRFTTDAHAIALANDTDYGLAAYLYTRDQSRAWRVGEALEYGMVGLNTGLISNEVSPFGGVKQSGLGREGSHYGLDEYLEIKYLCFQV
ncbi:MAG: NAD-dependent succinate-semialdehyde dehydrogenase [Burkholderiaceae bacterium]|nr:NAD-dependent succinate-semialdehyde dehydrogenase [Burkholderiaceae bacterium]